MVATNLKYQWDPDGEHIIDKPEIDDDDDDTDDKLTPPPDILVINENGIDRRYEEDGKQRN